jgi:hypothetical protein
LFLLNDSKNPSVFNLREIPMQHSKDRSLSYVEKIALTASSLSALSLAPMAGQAAIIYHSGAFGPVGVFDGNMFWDVDGANGAEFNLHGSSSTYVSMTSHGLNARGLVQSASQNPNYPVFKKLGLGFGVGPSLAGVYHWGVSGQGFRTLLSSGGSTVGSAAFFGGFSGGGNEYFGFRFTDGEGLFYGWANLNLDLLKGEASIQCWAYNNVADGSIAVGDTGGSTISCGQAPIPEPSTHALVLLGLGFSGVRAWRKRKQARAGLAI